MRDGSGPGDRCQTRYYAARTDAAEGQRRRGTRLCRPAQCGTNVSRPFASGRHWSTTSAPSRRTRQRIGGLQVPSTLTPECVSLDLPLGRSMNFGRTYIYTWCRLRYRPRGIEERLHSPGGICMKKSVRAMRHVREWAAMTYHVRGSIGGRLRSSVERRCGEGFRRVGDRSNKSKIT